MEWRQAAAWAGYPWHVFEALEGDEQALVVASYRADMQMSAIEGYEQVKAARRRAPRGSGHAA